MTETIDQAVGAHAPDCPIDILIRRVRQPGGQEWVVGALDRATRGPGSSPSCLVQGGSITDLHAIKANALSFSAHHDDESLSVAALGYLLATAAALRHHGDPISSQPRSTLNSAWLQLAAVLPKPWSTLLLEATQR